MTMSGSNRRILALVAATTLLFGAACGGGSGKPTAAADKATAERIVITSADVPDFTLEAEDESEDDAGSPIDECVGDNPLLAGENPRGVSGDNFVKDDGDLRVQSGASLTETAADARQAFTDLEGALTSQCVKDRLKEVINDSVATPGLKVGEISAIPLPAPKAAENVTASRLTIPLEADGERLSVFVDLTVLRQGRSFAGLFLFGSGSPFPESERERLTNLLGERLNGKDKNTPDTEPDPATETTRGSRSTGGATAGSTEFIDPSGVTFQYPQEWTAEPSGADSPLLLFIDPPDEARRRNVNILQQSGPGPSTLDEYTTQTVKQLTDLGATISESKPTTLSGFPAHRITYRGDLGKNSGEFQFLSVWTIRGDTAWLVTYTGDPARFDEALPDVERMITTIQLPA